MKTSLQLQLGTQLTLTPQLQQAIRLLQLSTLELQMEIQQTLDSNPMLELNEEEAEKSSQEESKSSKAEENSVVTDESIQMSDENIPKDLPVDSAWDDIYQGAPPPPRQQNSEETPSFEAWHSAETTLHEHLTWQLRMSPFSETDNAIATAIIDGIDESGFLTLSLEDIQHTVASEENPVEFDEIEAVLHRVQNFDPLGVAARDLRECLLLQLHHLPNDTPWLGKAREMIENHIDIIAQRDFPKLMRVCKVNEEQFRAAFALIQSLNPRPGSQINENKPEYVIPDVIIKKDNKRWTVELNPETTPRLKINNGYAGLVQRANNSPDNTFLRENLQEARWFIKSLQSRNETLLKVATCIVKHQRDFLEHGEEAMKPLVLHTISEALGMHESTISRVTTQKYMLTPRGIFELKYFFSSHVSTSAGGECSSTAIRALIKKIIAAENTRRPLSDHKIAAILKEQGINVARRTIAKYRESMNILPSNERKSIM